MIFLGECVDLFFFLWCLSFLVVSSSGFYCGFEGFCGPFEWFSVFQRFFLKTKAHGSDLFLLLNPAKSTRPKRPPWHPHQ